MLPLSVFKNRPKIAFVTLNITSETPIVKVDGGGFKEEGSETFVSTSAVAAGATFG